MGDRQSSERPIQEHEIELTYGEDGEVLRGPSSSGKKLLFDPKKGKMVDPEEFKVKEKETALAAGLKNETGKNSKDRREKKNKTRGNDKKDGKRGGNKHQNSNTAVTPSKSFPDGVTPSVLIRKGKDSGDGLN